MGRHIQTLDKYGPMKYRGFLLMALSEGMLLEEIRTFEVRRQGGEKAGLWLGIGLG